MRIIVEIATKIEKLFKKYRVKLKVGLE